MTVIHNCWNESIPLIQQHQAKTYQNVIHQPITFASVDVDDSVGVVPDHYNDNHNHQYIIYNQRWFVLFSFALLSMNSAWIWITWSPILNLMSPFWNVSVDEVDALMGIYMYIFVPFSFISLYLVVNFIGLQNGLLCGGVLNLIGSYIRYHGMEQYDAVYFGTVLCAMAQTFTLATPPLIAGSWFPSSERGTATGLGLLANQFGTAIGLGITIIVHFEQKESTSVNIDSEKLKVYLFIQFCVACLALLCIFLFGGDHPPTPPSNAAALVQKRRKRKFDDNNSKNSNKFFKSKEAVYSPPPTNVANEIMHFSDELPTESDHISPSYLDSLKLVVSDSDIIVYLLAFGMSIGTFYTIPTFISQLTPPDWSLKMDGYLGFLYQLSGVIGSFLAGKFVDKMKGKRTQMVTCAIIGISLLSLSILLYSLIATSCYYQNEWTNYPVQRHCWVPVVVPRWIPDSGIFVGIIAAGMSLAAFNTVGIEYGTGYAYPADELAVAGLFESSAELFGYLWVTMGGKFIARWSTQPSYVVLLLLCSLLLSLLCVSQVKCEIKRP